MISQQRTLVGSMMGSLVIVAVVLYFALVTPAHGLELPPLWLVGAQVAAGIVVHLVVESVGYRAGAIPPGTAEQEARTWAAAAFTTGSVLRFGLCESIALASVGAAFLVEPGGYAGYLTGAAISLLLMAVHAWPGEGPVGKTQTSLERDGARSYLREQLGLDPRSYGPIQEL
jgi:hypothetical protein